MSFYKRNFREVEDEESDNPQTFSLARSVLRVLLRTWQWKNSHLGGPGCRLS